MIRYDLRKAVFLDRDGVIIADTGYVHRWEDVRFLPGAIEAMRQFVAAGYVLVIVTNQSGLARGLYDEADYQRLSHRLRRHLRERGVSLLDIRHCPHHPQGVVPELARVCDCRKPAPGMLLAAAAAHGIDLASSIMIGDRDTDVQAGQAAGVRSSLRIGRAAATDGDGGAFPDLAAAAAWILTQAD